MSLTHERKRAEIDAREAGFSTQEFVSFGPLRCDADRLAGPVRFTLPNLERARYTFPLPPDDPGWSRARRV